MDRVFAGEPSERWFCLGAGRSLAVGSASEGSCASAAPWARKAGAGAAHSQPRPRLLGSRPGLEAVQPKRARPVSAQFRKVRIGQILSIFFSDIGLHSNGLKRAFGLR